LIEATYLTVELNKETGGNRKDCKVELDDSLCGGDGLEYCCNRQLLHVKTGDSYNVILEY